MHYSKIKNSRCDLNAPLKSFSLKFIRYITNYCVLPFTNLSTYVRTYFGYGNIMICLCLFVGEDHILYIKNRFVGCENETLKVHVPKVRVL